MPDTRIPASADHERRDQLRAQMAKLEDVHKALQPGAGESDPFAITRLTIDDVIADIAGEIAELTDTIGDATGDDYAAERSQHMARTI